MDETLANVTAPRLSAEFDLIVSSDTLNYFGALEEVMAAAAHALRPRGWLVFTLEKMPSSVRQADYHLEPHGRYRHAGDYVRRTLVRAGLYISRMNTDTIRFESSQPVDGWLVVARRKQGPSHSR